MEKYDFNGLVDLEIKYKNDYDVLDMVRYIKDLQDEVEQLDGLIKDMVDDIESRLAAYRKDGDELIDILDRIRDHIPPKYIDALEDIAGRLKRDFS